MMPRLKLSILFCIAVSVTASGQAIPERAFQFFTVTVGPEVPDEGTRVAVDWRNGQVRQFVVADVWGAERIASDLHDYLGQRLIVEAGKQVVVVDPASGLEIDRFMTLHRRFSPSGRYLAIQRFTPNGVAFLDSVISIYDLQKSPAQNREHSQVESNAGRIVYPDANIAAGSYSVAGDAADAHDLLSPLYWIDDELLAFATQNAGIVRIVLVAMLPDVGEMRRTESVVNLGPVLKSGVAAVDASGQIVIDSFEVLDMSPATITLKANVRPARFLRVPSITVTASMP